MIFKNSTFLKNSCNALKELNQTYFNIRNETNNLIKNGNITFPLDMEFLSFANSFKDNEASKINNSYIGSFEKIISENNASLEVIKIANLTLPKNKADIIQINNNKSTNISL